MMRERLTKTGEIAETPGGKKALVNGEGTAYLVQDSIILVWGAFDGNTVGEVSEKVATMAGKRADELREPVGEIARALREADLLVPA
jgi:hypothetical protein